MNDAQVAEAIRQAAKEASDRLADAVISCIRLMQESQERSEKVLSRLARRVERLANRLRMHDRKHDGETERTKPWHDLVRPRRAQVEEVYQYLLARRGTKSATVYNACKQTFSRMKGGYGDMENLKSYCYSIDIMDYVY